ncbi:MAG: hypothetical protein ACI4S3_04770 [Candidatus Gastranaerophilaceae bacterium]
MPIFSEKYYEVVNTIEKIISAFYNEKENEAFKTDDFISFNHSYSKGSSNYEIAVCNNKGGVINELMFTVLGNKKLFDKFISSFEKYCSEQLTDKEYSFKIQKQSLIVAKINVIYKKEGKQI